jgi:hypothetical protein
VYVHVRLGHEFLELVVLGLQSVGATCKWSVG